jgi:hypothetical protein
MRRRWPEQYDVAHKNRPMIANRAGRDSRRAREKAAAAKAYSKRVGLRAPS